MTNSLPPAGEWPVPTTSTPCATEGFSPKAPTAIRRLHKCSFPLYNVNARALTTLSFILASQGTSVLAPYHRQSRLVMGANLDIGITGIEMSFNTIFLKCR